MYCWPYPPYEAPPGGPLKNGLPPYEGVYAPYALPAGGADRVYPPGTGAPKPEGCEGPPGPPPKPANAGWNGFWPGNRGGLPKRPPEGAGLKGGGLKRFPEASGWPKRLEEEDPGSPKRPVAAALVVLAVPGLPKTGWE